VTRGTAVPDLYVTIADCCSLSAYGGSLEKGLEGTHSIWGIRAMGGRHRKRGPKFGGQPWEGPRISLLGGFQLEDEGTSIVLPEGSQRLLALLALRGRLVRRPVAAGTLWPVATEARASSSLRTALARLPDAAGAAVTATAPELGLSDRVSVDLWDSRALAHQLLAPPDSSLSSNRGPEVVSALSGELLTEPLDAPATRFDAAAAQQRALTYPHETPHASPSALMKGPATRGFVVGVVAGIPGWHARGRAFRHPVRPLGGESSVPVAVKVPVDGGTTDAQGRGDRGHRVLPGHIHLLRHLRLVGGHDRGPAAVAAPSPGGGQPSAGAFADEVAFELGQGGKDVENELAAGGGGVDRLLQATGPDPTVGQAGDGIDQMPQ
jgi:hypothetical protein